MSKNSFLKGAAILGISGIIIKIIGAFYRIPLSNIITTEGVGYYQTVNPYYTLLLAVSTSGLPTAVSKLIAEKRAIKDYIGAQKIFKISFLGFLIAGLTTSIAVLLLSKPIVTYMIGNENSYYSLLALVPALLFVPIMSAFRGYFQGKQNMVPTALSQLIEQLFKLIVGFPLAYLLLSSGLPKAAGGATFGASAGAIVGTILILIIYFKERRIRAEEAQKSIKCEQESTSNIIRNILAIAIPITIGASIVPIISSIDTVIIMKRLQEIGYTAQETTRLYGQLTGNAQTLINLPQALSIAVSMSLVPAISEAFVRREYNDIKNLTNSGIRVTLLIGLPSAIGLFVLSTPIINLLYFKNTVEEQLGAGMLLQVLSISVIFLTLVQSLTAILQGIGKPMIPVRNLAIGAVVKAVLSYTLTGIPAINIKGAAISTVATYVVASFLNFIYVKKYTKVDLKLMDTFIKPIISVTLMAIVVKISFTFTQSMVGSKLATIIAIGIGGIVYGLALLITGAITSEDFELLPKGEKLARRLKSIGLLRK
ncbi:polysaccharide biosynthesis protein [Gottschalkia purinilytica]|uniref:Polysaccharide biosynthesis protein n=1 Tax=Gottschalkia purinilytica TaxID=1503 RepID=A0A0L0W8D5_GOTPU|nr:polysaccharide biosynthesis protein [Gottschalkia purinilytica]KNF07809.1 polysaccharide biosynthesis protein [Gottschalkia purinilytica]